MKILLNFFKENYLFLITSIFIFFVLSPSINLDLNGSDWSVFDGFIKEFGHGFLPFRIPSSYYLTQYGTLFASIAYSMQFLGTDSTILYLNNILLRIAASFAIYFLVNWWSKRKMAAIIAGLFFGISYPGIESTTWSSHFLTYISVILLCIFLYFWRKFHIEPSKVNLKRSVILFGLSIFIAHIKIFALPLIVFIGEIYQFLIIRKHEKFKSLKFQHALYLLIIFLLFYFQTDIMKTTPELSGKFLHPYVIFQGLFNGYPPITQSLFLFIGNLIISPDILEFLKTSKLLSINQFSVWSCLIVMSLISFIFFIYLLKRRYYRLAFVSLIPLIFPAAIYYSTRMLIAWEMTWIISVMVGGTIFLLMLLSNFVIWRSNRKILELVGFSSILLLSHLLIPWLAFTQPQSDSQSAFNWFSRYYTIPAMGVGILYGLLFTHTLDLFRNISSRFSLIIKSYIGLAVIIFMILMFTLNALQINVHITRLYQDFDKSRHEYLWNLTSPYFLPLTKNHSLKTVYIEGELSSKDWGIIDSYFPHQISVNYENYNPPLERSYIFLSNKAELLNLLKTDNSFNMQNFVALRIIKGQVENIKELLIQEAKGEN